MTTLPLYDDEAEMFSPFALPQPTLDLLAGVTLNDINGFGTIRYTQGVGRQRGRQYVAVDLRGVFVDAAGVYWENAYLKQLAVETARAGIPADRWTFLSIRKEYYAQKRVQEYARYAQRPWCAAVWAVYHRLEGLMRWGPGSRRECEKIWLTLARATAVAVKESHTFEPATYSDPLANALHSLYPGCATYVEAAQQWLKEYAHAVP